MRMGLRSIWVIIIVLAFFLGTITTGIVFAHDEPKTLAEECAKKLDKEDLNLDGMFCLAILQFDELFPTDPNKPVLYLEVDPDSQVPALVVNDGTNDVFTVNKDGSIQIGFNTVILNPDGTVTGGPLFLLAGSKVDGELILAPKAPCTQKDLAQFLGGKWKCSNPTSVVASAGSAPLAPNIVALHFEQVPEISTSNVGINNAVELAKWRIDFITPPPLVGNPPIRVIDNYLSAQLKSSQGDVNSQLTLATSTDDNTWVHNNGVSADTLNYKGRFQATGDSFIFTSLPDGNVVYISLRFYSTDNLVVPVPVQMQHGSATMILILPEGATVTQILPV